jgi:SAM-dependent methyltransferase
LRSSTCRWWSRRGWGTTGRRRISATFLDHFSRDSRSYAQARPTYPDALFARLAALAPGRDAAWDCATGSGQAAIGLARHFARVEATDASAQQVANATPASNVAYSVQPGESTTFAAASFDAVCVAQALHWLDLDRFYAEARRVLRPRGILLVTAYGWSSATPEVDAVMKGEVLPPIEPLWPPQNQLIMRGYRDVPFPFERVEFPAMDIQVSWTLEQYLAYIATWTAMRRMLEKDPGFLQRVAPAMRAAWGAEQERIVTMPLVVLCGRHG